MVGIIYTTSKSDDDDGLAFGQFLDALVSLAFECEVGGLMHSLIWRYELHLLLCHTHACINVWYYWAWCFPCGGLVSGGVSDEWGENR